jgi:hypothetical protein
MDRAPFAGRVLPVDASGASHGSWAGSLYIRPLPPFLHDRAGALKHAGTLAGLRVVSILLRGRVWRDGATGASPVSPIRFPLDTLDRHQFPCGGP